MEVSNNSVSPLLVLRFLSERLYTILAELVTVAGLAVVVVAEHAEVSELAVVGAEFAVVAVMPALVVADIAVVSELAVVVTELAVVVAELAVVVS